MKPVAGVRRTYTKHFHVLTPGLWEKLPHSSGLQLCKESTTVHTTEVTEIPIPIKLLCNYCESGSLMQVESSRRYEIPGREEVAHFRTDIPVNLSYYLINIAF